jgi:biopolymer transport protein ExbB/TolQ
MLEMIIIGGPMMVPLMVESVMTLAAVVDRYLAFRANRKIDTRALRAELLQCMEENRLEDALLLCASTPGPVAATLLVGLQTYERLRKRDEDPDAMRLILAKTMEDFQAHALTAVTKRMNMLASIGNTAPLFGMTGTVTGMIGAFDAMVKAAGLDAKLVAGGIMEALITTAAGLMIALAAVIPHNFFTGMAEAISLEIDEATAELVEFVAMLQAKQRKA